MKELTQEAMHTFDALNAIMDAYETNLKELSIIMKKKQINDVCLKRLEIEAKQDVLNETLEDGKKKHTNDQARDLAIALKLDNKEYNQTKEKVMLDSLLLTEINGTIELLKFKKSAMVSQTQLVVAMLQKDMVPNFNKLQETFTHNKGYDHEVD